MNSGLYFDRVVVILLGIASIRVNPAHCAFRFIGSSMCNPCTSSHLYLT